MFIVKRLIAALFLLCLGCHARPAVIDADLKARLSSATRVELTCYGLDSVPDGHIVSLKQTGDVRSCVQQLTADRKWKRIAGELTSERAIKLRFEDSVGRELWRCKVVSKTLMCSGTDGEQWQAFWPEGIEWLLKLANEEEQKGEEKVSGTVY